MVKGSGEDEAPIRAESAGRYRVRVSLQNVHGLATRHIPQSQVGVVVVSSGEDQTPIRAECTGLHPEGVPREHVHSLAARHVP